LSSSLTHFVCVLYIIYIVSTTAVTPSLWIQGTEERVCVHSFCFYIIVLSLSSNPKMSFSFVHFQNV
jgi:hypothetical protein